MDDFVEWCGDVSRDGDSVTHHMDEGRITITPGSDGFDAEIDIETEHGHRMTTDLEGMNISRKPNRFMIGTNGPKGHHGGVTIGDLENRPRMTFQHVKY